VYSLLLRAYPAPFRHEYGQPMARLFRDEARDALRASGAAALTDLWVSTLIDLAKTAFAEHIWEVFHMPMEKILRWAGPGTIIGGLLWMLFYIFEIEDGLGVPLYALAFLLMVAGIAGLYQRLSADQGFGARLAFGLTLFGLLLLLGLALSFPFLSAFALQTFWNSLWLLLAVFMPLIVGLAALGVITLHSGALGSLSFVPLLQAVAMLGIFLTLSETRDPVEGALHMLYGVSWMLLGLALWLGREQPAGPELLA
jgi:hypothetical protein